MSKKKQGFSIFHIFRTSHFVIYSRCKHVELVKARDCLLVPFQSHSHFILCGLLETSAIPGRRKHTTVEFLYTKVKIRHRSRNQSYGSFGYACHMLCFALLLIFEHSQTKIGLV